MTVTCVLQVDPHGPAGGVLSRGTSVARCALERGQRCGSPPDGCPEASHRKAVCFPYTMTRSLGNAGWQRTRPYARARGGQGTLHLRDGRRSEASPRRGSRRAVSLSSLHAAPKPSARPLTRTRGPGQC